MVSRSHVRGVSTSCEANESFWRSIGIPEAARRSVGERQRGQMVRVSAKLLKEAGSGLNKTLSQILVCPVSKQPLRFDSYPMPKIPLIVHFVFFFNFFFNCLNFVYFTIG